MSGAIPHNSAGALALQGFTGLMHGLSNEMYHGSGYGISNSGLLQIMKSPAHYFGLSLDPLRPPPEEQAGQLLGLGPVLHQGDRLFHVAVLHPIGVEHRRLVGDADVLDELRDDVGVPLAADLVERAGGVEGGGGNFAVQGGVHGVRRGG